MNEEEYKSVVENMHMKVRVLICTQVSTHIDCAQNGLIFGLPVVLDTDREDINVGDKVLLKYKGVALATVTIDSKWVPNKPVEALKCYGATAYAAWDCIIMLLVILCVPSYKWPTTMVTVL